MALDDNHDDDDDLEGDDSDEDTEACPFCGADTCEHHALSLDLTFREVLGGALYEACGHRLSRITSSLAGDDEDAEVDDEAFDQLEELLDELPHLVSIHSEFHGGPGQSSALRHYWVENPATLPVLKASLMWDGATP